MPERQSEWIVTEHRQIVVRREEGLVREDAMRIALDGSQPGYVASDHTRRDIYAVSCVTVEEG
jgi:hypothetical protein